MLAKSSRNKIFSACIFTLPALLISVCCALLFGLLVNSLNGQIIIGANWLIRWLCRVHGAVGERVGSHLPAGGSAAGRRAHLVLPASRGVYIGASWLIRWHDGSVVCTERWASESARIYLQVCRRLGVVPISYYLRHVVCTLAPAG